MEIMHAYRGRLKGGRFTPTKSGSIPEDTEVYMVITDRTPSAARKQGEAIKRFMAAINSINDEVFTSEDFAELENNRANFDRKWVA